MNVYTVADGSRTAAMTRLMCRDEAKDLHDLIEGNLDLIPGDQIDPVDPRRWLLVRREMPVPDPNSGSVRWSIDFLLADQDAVPTFIECKRFTDTRARREIVGQMLEYAANGSHYWTREDIQDLAEETAKGRRQTVEEALRDLLATEEPDVDTFFDQVEENLRTGRVRLVFALEDSPFELRSIVDYLNGQMERSEVLLVEIRQFESKGHRVVVPMLFGYTEEARRIKRTANEERPSRRAWNRDSFLAEARLRLTDEGFDAVQRVLLAAEDAGYDVAWGTGIQNGSFSPKDRSQCPKSLISVYTDGRMRLNFKWLDTSDAALDMRDRLALFAAERLGLALPADHLERYPEVAIGDWQENAQDIGEFLRGLRTGRGRSAAVGSPRA